MFDGWKCKYRDITRQMKHNTIKIRAVCTDFRNDDKTTRHAASIPRIICSIVILYFTRVHDDVNEGSFVCKLKRIAVGIAIIIAGAEL